MTPKALILSISLSSVLFLASEIQAHSYTQEQVAQAQELANTMRNPVDIEALLAEADKWKVLCDISTRIRISSCKKKIEIAKIDADIEASKERTEASKKRTAILQAENEKLKQENADMIREIQKRIREDK